jgi:hypothetical protein
VSSVSLIPIEVGDPRPLANKEAGSQAEWDNNSIMGFSFLQYMIKE